MLSIISQCMGRTPVGSQHNRLFSVINMKETEKKTSSAKAEVKIEAKASEEVKTKDVPEFVKQKRALQNAVYDKLSLKILSMAMAFTREYVKANGYVPADSDIMIEDAIVQKNLGTVLDAIRRSRTLGFIPDFKSKDKVKK